MKREPKLVTLKMRKLEIYNAGKENFFRFLALLEDYDKLRFENVNLINTLKTILGKMDPIEFAFEDDAVEDEPVKKPKESGVEFG